MAAHDEPAPQETPSFEIAADAALPSDVDAAGVDLTLVREYLALTPAERLASLARAAQAIERLRQAKPV